MGCVALDDVVPRRKQASDRAKQVSAASFDRTIWAMRIGREAGSGELIYEGEQPLQYQARTREVPCLLQRDGQDPLDTSVRWWRYEVKIETGGPVAAREQLVVAEHPYTLEAVYPATFRPPTKDAWKRPDSKSRTFESSDQVIEWVDDLSTDYWETDGFLTAALSRPKSFLEAGARRNQPKSMFWLFGLVDDFDAKTNKLFSSEHAEQLAAWTRRGTIRFAQARERKGVEPYLADEVKENSDDLLLLAIKQALAGPPYADTAPYEGQPVIKWADSIYRGLLNERNRRYVDRSDSQISKEELDERRGNENQPKDTLEAEENVQHKWPRDDLS